MTHALRGFLIVSALVGTTAPARPDAPLRVVFTEVHMGVPVRVTLYAPDRATAERSARAAFARIARLDTMLSDYRPDSELSRLSATSGVWVPVSAELFAVLEIALRVACDSDGAFDPTVGPLSALWRDARRDGRLPSAQAIARARARAGWRLVETDRVRRTVRLGQSGMRLDLGGVAKGFILQEALAVLDASGTPAALLEAGGDIVAGDAPPGRAGWHIATPYADAAFSARTGAIARGAIATSGPVSQFLDAGGARYSHVIDPRTGLGLTRDRVTGVLAPDGAVADALATALGVLDPADAPALLAKYPGVLATFGAR